MKVLFVGHLTEGSGWSNASIDFITSLHAAGVDVVCRNLRLTETNAELPPLIQDLMKKDDSDATHCIQHLLPHHLFGSDKFEKNIAFVETEIKIDIQHSWFEHLKLVDEVWVPNATACKFLIESGFNAKIIHHATDVYKYKNLYPQMNIPEINHTYKFYCITDLNDRKNLPSVIKCFHHEFDPSEPVSLILKVKKFGTDKKTLTQYIQGLCNDIKKNMRMYKDIRMYHPEVIMTGHSSENDIYSLHRFADCFVNLSHGESWSIPSLDAIGFGNPVISTDVGGPLEYLQHSTIAKPYNSLEMPKRGVLIDSIDTICDCRDSAFPELFTGRDFWKHPNERDVCRAMRYYYTDKTKNDNFEFIKKFSYENIGKKMVEELL